MNKKIIAIAIATAMAAPVAMADVKLSGRVGIDFTTKDTDGAANDVRDLKDNAASRFQFDGTSGNAYARIAYDARASKNLNQRDNYLGYKLGGGMSIQVGRMPTAAKNAEKDPYITTFLETRGSIANSYTKNIYGSNSFVDNLVQFAFKAGSAKVKVQYDPTDYAPTAGTKTNNAGHIAVGVSGKSGPVAWHASYNNGSADGDNTAASYGSQSNIKLGGSMKFGTVKASLNYTSMDTDAATAAEGTATDSIFVDANMAMGKGLSANIGFGTRSGDVAADDADYIRLAVTKKLSKGAKVYGGYTSTDYDAASSSADTSEVGIGMIVKF